MPKELIAPHFPENYTTQLSLEGKISDEITTSLKNQGLEKPQFRETYSRKNGFKLLLVNENYSLSTKNMISGIFNPLEMIELTIESLVRFRDPNKFGRLQKETSMQVSNEGFRGKRIYRVDLSPRKERFAYTYEDQGNSIKEKWLQHLSASIDSVSLLIYKISLVQCTKVIHANQSIRPRVDTTAKEYIIRYTEGSQPVLPHDLSVYINAHKVLEITADYQKVNKYTVFKSRYICFISDKKTKKCLTMNYGDYNFKTSIISKIKRNMQEKPSTADINKAAVLAEKATQAMDEGELEKAMRYFKKLIRNYPQTPQGVEAGNLVKNLPQLF